jgi:mRNA interferase MazF
MTQDLKQAGQIVAFRYPQTDLEKGKLRPALLLAKLPNEYDDWLTCMISSQTHHYVCPFADIFSEIANFRIPIYGGNHAKSPIYGGS